MPFNTDQKGKTIWRNPTEEELNSALSSDTEVDKKTLLNSVEAQLSAIAQKALSISSDLSQSNKVLIKSISGLLNKPIGGVDIILPVYGGLHIASKCIEAIMARTNYPFKLIIIDDCSPDEKTKSWLRKWQKDNPKHLVLFNRKNKGFAASVNVGIKAGNNDYVCILNSDVLVTDKWLVKMVLTLEANEKNQIVCPCTNNTALVSIPMQEGLSYIDMNKGLEALSPHKFPEILPTGFCFLFRRELTNEIGYLDESYGKGYGEDSDYHMKILSYVRPNGDFPNYRAVLDDSTYVFHERSSTFGALDEGEHLGQRQSGAERFHKVWPQFKTWRKTTKLEENLSYLKLPLPNRVIQKNSPYNIAFVVFGSSFCGGMSFITDIVNELQERGVNAKVVQIHRGPNTPNIPTMSELRVGVVHFNTPEEFIKNFSEKVFDSGIVVSSTCEIFPIVEGVCSSNNRLINLLFTQSFDPAIAPNEETSMAMIRSYTNAKYILSSSKWLNNRIKISSGKNTLGFVQPGVNHNLFYPRGRNKGDERPTVAIVLNPQDQYRGFDRGVTLAYELKELAKSVNMDVRILGIGIGTIHGAPYVTCLGKLTQARLAQVLGTEVDIICDPAFIHSYGLASLEGMVSGCVPVCWDNDGIYEYAINGENAIIHSKNTTPKNVAASMLDLLSDEDRLNKMKDKATKIVHSREEAVSNFIDKIEKEFKLNYPKKEIAVITPHLRKFGGPTTIVHLANTLKDLGHDVKMYSIHSDVSTEIHSLLKVPLSLNWKNIQDTCDVLIVNSDNSVSDELINCSAKKKILLKLSHNPRFKELEDNALKLPWDKIITSTDWLVKACKDPYKGWTHPPREATRLGWVHYSHEIFKSKYDSRPYFVDGKMRITTLIHHHPTKGTKDSLKILEELHKRHGNRLIVSGVGEWPEFKTPPWMQYIYNPTRKQMAEVFKTTDVFLSTSKSEGLGRMCLEAMSASTAIVKYDTQAEFAHNKENCLIVPQGDMQGLLDSIELLASDLKLFKKIIVGAWDTACKFADETEYKENLKRIINGV